MLRPFQNAAITKQPNIQKTPTMPACNPANAHMVNPGSEVVESDRGGDV